MYVCMYVYIQFEAKFVIFRVLKFFSKIYQTSATNQCSPYIILSPYVSGDVSFTVFYGFMGHTGNKIGEVCQQIYQRWVVRTGQNFAGS